MTGAAGFIGANLVLELLRNHNPARVVGIDDLNGYYDVDIKDSRLQEIEAEARRHPSCKWIFVKANIADKALIDRLFLRYEPHVVVNLAAQAGVRYSITNPGAYIESNLIGFYNILEACRHSYDRPARPAEAASAANEAAAANEGEESGSEAAGKWPEYSGVEHLVYASSSSVYGSNKKIPYSTDDKTDSPVSLYAATKKSNELMAHAYSKLYDIPSTGLRFFTVYGPAGRPDMAYFGFTDKLRAGEKIRIFNYGDCRRDFTYVDDIVQGVVKVMLCAPERKTGEDGLPEPPFAVYNIGNSHPENLLDFVKILHEELVAAEVLSQGHELDACMELVPMQPGDVPVTFADVSALERDFGFKPSTSLREGLRRFAQWYKSYYRKDVGNS